MTNKNFQQKPCKPMRYFLQNKETRLGPRRSVARRTVARRTVARLLMAMMMTGYTDFTLASATDLKGLSAMHAGHIVADFEVTGKVTGETGDALPGASILIKGTTRGTSADENGNFRISIPDNAN